MHNQKAVFNLCPNVNHQFSTHMKELEFDLNQDTIQATIDICLHLTYFRNLTQNKLGPVQIVISVVSEQLAVAIPYQIVSNKTYQSYSKIDLETYTSSLYVLQPWQRSMIDEMVIFKIHVPIDQVETGKLKITIALQTMNQMSFDQNDLTKRLSQVTFTLNSVLYVDSFFPCLFDSQRISLQGNVYSHLLGCKYSQFSNIYRHHFYQAIDHLVICYNKLREKTSPSNKHSSIENESQFADLPLFIDMKKYPQFEEIRSFIQKRIFQQQSMKQHRAVLQRFVQKFIPQMRQKLLIVWKLFLKMVSFPSIQHSRQQFYQKLGIQLKKRIEFKVQKSANYSISEIQKKNNFLEINYPQYNSSILRTHEQGNYFFVQKQIAQNSFRQRFDDKKIFNFNKKMYVSNIQFPYPNVKVRLNKTLKLHQKEQLETVTEPHIVVLVHGLGASSNSFTQFQTCLKNIYWKNLFVLNSNCNENSVDESIDEMGRKLSIQVTQFIIQNQFGQNFELSFIGHSLGGLIIRAALPRLQCYKFNMKTLITLSTPHLGYFYHNSALNKAGMWAISKFSQNQVINNLLMIDDKKQQIEEQNNYRNSYLYTLSVKPGIGCFQHVMFCGSMEDYFVSPLSAFATTKQSIHMKKDLKAKIWEQMRTNIESNLINCNIYRLLVEFEDKNQASIKDQLIGRASHVMYLSSRDFISYIILAFKDLFA